MAARRGWASTYGIDRNGNDVRPAYEIEVCCDDEAAFSQLSLVNPDTHVFNGCLALDPRGILRSINVVPDICVGNYYIDPDNCIQSHTGTANGGEVSGELEVAYGGLTVKLSESEDWTGGTGEMKRCVDKLHNAVQDITEEKSACKDECPGFVIGTETQDGNQM